MNNRPLTWNSPCEDYRARGNVNGDDPPVGPDKPREFEREEAHSRTGERPAVWTANLQTRTPTAMAAMYVIIRPFFIAQFRGIGTGQRVLDVGSGVGDVALLAARLVGPSDAVIGVERDPNTVAAASSRASAAGLANVRFIQGEVGSVTTTEAFDAVVERFIIEFLPDAGTVMRSLASLLRPGGVMAFQDACWGTWLDLNQGFSLRSSIRPSPQRPSPRRAPNTTPRPLSGPPRGWVRRRRSLRILMTR